MEASVSFLTANWSEIVVGIFAVLRVAEVIVKLTPTDRDNVIFAIVDSTAAKILGRR